MIEHGEVQISQPDLFYDGGPRDQVKNGIMTAPNGTGIGVAIDPDYLAKARQVTASLAQSIL